MRALEGTRASVEIVEGHNHVCDLVHEDYPLVSLYTDGRENWVHVWCDTDGSGAHRWLVFPVSRKQLVGYLGRNLTLRSIVLDAGILLAVDVRPFVGRRSGRRSEKSVSRSAIFVDPDAVSDYLPTDDSFFDTELAPDIDLTKQLVPTSFDVPIDGVWFGHDFAALFKRYERLYAFFYATQPRFVRTIEVTLERLLRAPWKGGFSRVNLYSRLAARIPAIHALKVDRLQFASPGAVRFEAISTIGESIRRATLQYLENQGDVDERRNRIQSTLNRAKVNKRDLSQASDSETPLRDADRQQTRDDCREIAEILGIVAEIRTVERHSPNTVVYAKAVVSLVRQVAMLSKFERMSMTGLVRGLDLL